MAPSGICQQCLSHDSPTPSSVLQIVPALEEGLHALQAQGVELVDVDVSLLMRTYEVEAPNTFSYQYEMPRELAWSAPLAAAAACLSACAASSSQGHLLSCSLQRECFWPAAPDWGVT